MKIEFFNEFIQCGKRNPKCSPPMVYCVFRMTLLKNKRLVDLLENAYVQSRYNKDFTVSKEDCDEIIRRLEKLRILAKDFCLAKIKEHKKNVKK